jgi:hypothetical protein
LRSELLKLPALGQDSFRHLRELLLCIPSVTALLHIAIEGCNSVLE